MGLLRVVEIHILIIIGAYEKEGILLIYSSNNTGLLNRYMVFH